LKLYIPDSYMTGVNREKVANHFILEVYFNFVKIYFFPLQK